jgi:cation diffusion facilitator family transporter
MIAILIGYEAITRFIWPVAINFNEAIPIAGLGLLVNVASVLLLSGGNNGHGIGHEHGHGHSHGHTDRHEHDWGDHVAHEHTHDHEHAGVTAHRDNNMRAAVVHVLADAAVSILVIAALLLGRFLGWAWMDPVVGLVGAIVTAAWAYTLIRDTGAILLDMTPDRGMAERMRATIETDGDRLTDFHVWRLGPGHLGAIVSVTTHEQRGPDYYQARLARFRSLSHVTVEVQHH